jgi:hypothetical protein
VDEAAKGQGISPEGHISSMYQKDSVHRLAGNSVVGSKVVRFAGESVPQEKAAGIEEEMVGEARERKIEECNPPGKKNVTWGTRPASEGWALQKYETVKRKKVGLEDFFAEAGED